MKEIKLILLRHGESVFNKKNLFTGWTDVDLSPNGISEAKNAGSILKEKGIYPDICFTSYLKRAIHTAQLVLKKLEWEQIDCIKSYKLNERHYGAWQEKNKDEIKKEVGENFFISVRRGYDTPPPLLDDQDKRLPQYDLKYKDIDPNLLPKGESLKETKKRVINYFYQKIVPELLLNKTVLIVAHGNSLRSLIMQIENISKDEIVKTEIKTGEPIIYEFNDEMNMIKKNTLS